MTTKGNTAQLQFFCLIFFWAPILLSCTKSTSQMAADLPGIAPPFNDSVKIDSTTRRYLALGDSYTIGQSVPATDRYPVQAVDALRKSGYTMADADIVATSGWTTTDLLEAIRDKADTPSFNLVTLLIGVNNQYQGGTIPAYKAEFTSLLERSIKYAGNRADRVIVLSIPDYSVTPFAANSDQEKIALEIDSFNFVNKQVAQAYHVTYLDVTGASRKAAKDQSLIAYDGLHYSGKEYTIWVNAMLPMMKEILK